MSDNINELVKRLRGQHNALKSRYLKGLFSSAADTIEALRENLKVEVKSANYWMEQSFEDRARADRAEAENARLREALTKIEKIEEDHWSDEAASICSKALEVKA